MGIAEQVEDYIAWLNRAALSVHTKRAYTVQIRGFARWLADDPAREAQVLADDHDMSYAVRDWKAHRLGTAKDAPKSIQLGITAVDSFCGWANRGRPDVRQVRVPRGDPRSLRPEARTKVLRAAERRGPRDLALVATGLHGGLRLGEVVALDVDDVELHARKGVLHVRRGKGDQPREVYAGPQLREVLSRWRAVRRDLPGAGGPAFFLSQQGRRVAPSTVDRVMRELGSTAGVPLSMHVLRHTCASDMLAAGLPPNVVAEHLGHRDVRTLSAYTRPHRESLEAAASAVHYDY